MKPQLRVLNRDEENWPPELNHLQTPPEKLWVEGNLGLSGGGVGVVGARHATFEGAELAHEIGASLAAAGFIVVSGFAAGIDAAAHRGAVAAGGRTVAVLGTGIDIDYPRPHGVLREQVRNSGCLVTEFPPGTGPKPHHFPQRNRIIAALCRAVIVVEAAEKSGALSTARWARDLGRDVLAVPGYIKSPLSRGPNLLIRDGAVPYLGLQSLLEELPAYDRGPDRAELPAELGVLLDAFGSKPLHPDALAAKVGADPLQIATRLSQLELAGLVQTLPGGLVRRPGVPSC